MFQFTSTANEGTPVPVSYTHLDVYKRQHSPLRSKFYSSYSMKHLTEGLPLLCSFRRRTRFVHESIVNLAIR